MDAPAHRPRNESASRMGALDTSMSPSKGCDIDRMRTIAAASDDEQTISVSEERM